MDAARGPNRHGFPYLFIRAGYEFVPGPWPYQVLSWGFRIIRFPAHKTEVRLQYMILGESYAETRHHDWIPCLITAAAPTVGSTIDEVYQIIIQQHHMAVNFFNDLT
ncbi:hypothetical protein SCFA_730013 [anaerobic digester metagenome]|uniref:Uncharacterized protein n=1 Tax=anaerobic digester metagenome TaxID=1263854 RepID=A0A485M5V1_9ZZZZ